jgi:hypothetical protein
MGRLFGFRDHFEAAKSYGPGRIGRAFMPSNAAFPRVERRRRSAARSSERPAVHLCFRGVFMSNSSGLHRSFMFAA